MSKPKLLGFYDLEVSPALGFFYPPMYQTNILKVEKYQVLMSASYAFYDGEKLGKIHHVQLSDFPARFKSDRWDDTDITLHMHRVMKDAPPWTAHNGDNFDSKMINTYFLKHGLDPLPPEKTIDTLKAARRHFRFASNKLGEIGKELGIGDKTEVTVGSLWYDYIVGDHKKAGKLLRLYNNQDVQLLFDVYMKLRPYIQNHPSLAVRGDSNACPKCQGHNLQYNGLRYTNTMVYRRVFCKDCRSWFKERQGDKDLQNKPDYVN